MIQAEIITVGDELLAGIVINSNAAYIGEKLFELGIYVRWASTVGDDEKNLLQALEVSYNRASLVIITGGLGPTHDDITKRIVAEFFHSKLVFDSGLFARIKELYKNMGRKLSEEQRCQAEVPDKAEIIENTIGTAPGLIFTQEDRVYYILPGVPSEMKRMMQKHVLPLIGRMAGARELVFQILRTTGITESELSRRIQSFSVRFPDIRLSLLPQTQGVTIRIMVLDCTPEDGKRMLMEGETYIRDTLEPFIFGTGETSIEEVVAQLLKNLNRTISVAESCTGGLVSHKLTNVPGSSAYFNRGVVAYHNTAKTDILGVGADILKKYGAVSAETAVAMAEGVRHSSGSDIGISTTGIAGPGGATPEKPVGLVYLGYSENDRSFFECRRYAKNRIWNKERFSVAALDMLRRALLGYAPNPL
jgi:nicotinamide-nucleotide amidase